MCTPILSIVVLLSLLFLSSTHSVSPSGFDSKLQTQFIENVRQRVNKENWSDVHNSILFLLKLKQPLDEFQFICEKTTTTTTSNEDPSIENLYYRVASHIALKCTNSPSQEFIKLVESQIQLDKSIANASSDTIYYIARIMLLFRAHLPNLVNKTTLRDLFFVNSNIKTTNSLEHSGYIAESLSIFAKLVGGASDDKVFDQLFKWSKHVAQLAMSATQIKSIDQLHASSVFLRGVHKLADTTKVTKKFPKRALDIASQHLLQLVPEILKSSSSSTFLQQAYDLIEVLSTLDHSSIHRPLLVSDIHIDDKHVRLTAQTLFAEPLDKTIRIERAFNSHHRQRFIIEDEEMKQNGINYEFDYTNDQNAVEELQKKVGEIIFELKFGQQQLKKSIRFVTEIEISHFDMSILEKVQHTTQIASRLPVNYPNKLPFASVEPKQLLEFSTQLNSKATQTNVELQQVNVRLLPNFENTWATEYYLTLRISNDGSYQGRADFSKDTFRKISGRYGVELIVADSFVSNPIQWKLGEIELKFTEDDEFQPTEEQKAYSLKPEIHHIFRPSEKRSHGILTLAFNFFVLVPLILFILAAVYVSGNQIFASCPSSPIQFVLNITFQVGLIAMMGVLFMFFIEWRILRVLKALVLLGSVTSVIGAFALRGRIKIE